MGNKHIMDSDTSPTHTQTHHMTPSYQAHRAIKHTDPLSGVVEGGAALEGLQSGSPVRPVSGDATQQPVKLDVPGELLLQGLNVVARGRRNLVTIRELLGEGTQLSQLIKLSTTPLYNIIIITKTKTLEKPQVEACFFSFL